jgi:hypothetical protein
MRPVGNARAGVWGGANDWERLVDSTVDAIVSSPFTKPQHDKRILHMHTRQCVWWWRGEESYLEVCKRCVRGVDWT